MDPTVTTGNIFTAKGVQNHIVSDQWKASVRREYCIERRWQNSFNKGYLERERDVVASARYREETAKFSPSRALLPLSMRGKTGVLEDLQARERGIGMGRRDLLTFLRAKQQPLATTAATFPQPPVISTESLSTPSSPVHGALVVSSRDIGSRAGDRSNLVLMADRRTACVQSSYGRKPVIAGSFFRRSGVF
jgi:hypothetical protein